MRMKMFVILYQAKLGLKNKKNLNLAVVKLKPVQVPKFLL